MKSSREHRIMHGLLILCIAAGFACFAFIFLPDQLAKAGVEAKAPTSNGPKNISELLPQAKPSPEKKPVKHTSGTVARFVPEAAPADPYNPPTAQPQPEDDYDDDFDVVGGAGAAIDGDSFEAREHLIQDEDFGDIHARAGEAADAPDLAIGDPYSDMASSEVERAYLNPEPKPQTVKHRVSSLARGEPATIDSERGKRKKPWLLSPRGFEKDVAFWRDIYAKYDKNYVVLHHPRYLDIVYDVVNLSDIEADPRLNDIERSHMKDKRIGTRKTRVEDSLKVLATNPPASRLTHEQWRIKNLFSNVHEKNKYKRAYTDDWIRGQLGQRDKFEAGLAYSGRYLGEIEAIFESYGLPKELTRLIFVESMFNPKAISSAGASGIWQFMPRTGRLFLSISKIADERNDPLASTHAAAKLLSQNYQELGTWPLALNAYNAGRGRLKQAVIKLGTRDIGTIMRNFKHRSYGFASRNFYLEFVAAYEVAEHAERYFGRVNYDEPISYDVVRSNYHMSLPEVARLASVSMEELRELNPAFTSQVTSGRKLIPRRKKVRVPERRGDVFLASAARAPKSRTGALKHVVRRGETLSSIAAAYGVSAGAIMRSNKHVGRRLRKGQKLIIPSGNDI
jgi:membrane-bound lytic murein transglycosylase D